jgi:alginate O-acetyltransferase complex protein AlgI
MIFSSLTFICIFLPVVFLAYVLIPHIKLKNALLIAASLLFYAYGEPVYVALMLLSTVINYIFGRLLEAHRNRAVLVGALAANLLFLGVFKYAGMFASTAEMLCGIPLHVPVIGLPIGISFYTFQAMSYILDVYRKDVQASRSYPKLLLFISFFPQLMAGPIIKYHDVDAQLDNRTVSAEGIATGLRRFSVGLAKKVLIANTMALVVDSIYSAELTSVNVAVAWIAALAYIMQIYFDFSGYSDMAIGLARMFGFRYKENFNYPYTSSSIKEFWRRWHISLSTWFKEYLYIPLGGNRKGKLRASINKLIVFFFCGLWHGASWTFVVWGLFHGLFLLAEEYLPIKKLPKALGLVYALVVVTIGFVIFRAHSLEQAGYFITQMFAGFHFETACQVLAMRQLDPFTLFIGGVAVLACMPVARWVKAGLAGRFAARLVRPASFAASLALLALCILTLSGGGYNPFIYFRF